jgi:TolB-like protein
LWHAGTPTDFEHGLNSAMMRLREALGDSAENPRYIETLPRHGYRLMVQVEKPGANPSEPFQRRWTIWLTVLGILVFVAVLASTAWRLGLLKQGHTETVDSLAVLPLVNLSGNPDDENFADGMTQALIAELGKTQSIRTISWQSVKQFKGTNKPLQQIAVELQVKGFVEGSVLRIGGKVRISVQLISAKPERHLWSESYQRNSSDVIALQDELAHAIAHEMRTMLRPQQQTARPP